MKEEENQDIQARKKTIILYDDLLESTEDLTSEQLGEVMRLIWRRNRDDNFQFSHKDTLVRATTKLIWDTISACNKNHAKKSEQQKAAGRASAEARRRKQAELEAKAEQALDQLKAENIEKNDKNLDNKGISIGPRKEQPITNSDKSKEQTVSSSHQLQKTQQPPKPQQLQKKQQLDWQCVAGLKLTEQQQNEATRIRKANNTTKKTRTFTQASLKQFLTQVKYSIDAGISIDEVLEVWEGKQWVTWTHSYYAKEIASDIKAQSQTAKDLKRVQASQESVKDNDWDNFEITPLVKDLVQFSIDEKIEQSKKGGN